MLYVSIPAGEIAAFIYKNRLEKFNFFQSFILDSHNKNHFTYALIDLKTLQLLNQIIDHTTNSASILSVKLTPIEDFIIESVNWQKKLFEDIQITKKKYCDTKDQFLRILVDLTFFSDEFVHSANLDSFINQCRKFTDQYRCTFIFSYFYEYLPQNLIVHFSRYNFKCFFSESITHNNGGRMFNFFNFARIDHSFLQLFLNNNNFFIDLLKKSHLGSKKTKHASFDSISMSIMDYFPDLLWLTDNNLYIKYLSPYFVNNFLKKDISCFLGKNIGQIFYRSQELIESFKLKDNQIFINSGYGSDILNITLEDDRYNYNTNILRIQYKDYVIGFIGISRPQQKNASQGGNTVESTDSPPASSDNSSDVFDRGITSREFEIIQSLLSGLQNKEIGEKLFIAEITVKKHLSNIYKKLNVRNRLELMKLMQTNISAQTGPE